MALTRVKKLINRSNKSSLSVEQSKFAHKSTMKLGVAAICVNVSNINSLVSAGTGGSRLIGLGVEGAAGVEVSARAGVADLDGSASAPFGFGSWEEAKAAGEEGREEVPTSK